MAMTNSKENAPRTKQIALKYYHFRKFVNKGLIKVKYIDTKEQLADIFTKPLPDQDFLRLRKALCGW